MRLHTFWPAVLLVLLSVACPAQRNADLDTTTQQIEAKLAAERALSYHYEITHPQGGHYDYGTNQTVPVRLLAVPGQCNMGREINFKVITDVRVTSAIQAFQEGKEGREGWIPTIQPNYYKVLIEASSGTRHLELDFADSHDAADTAALIRQAVEICGKDKILSSKASAAEAGNITLDQTLGFINESFSKEGEFSYTDGTEGGINVRYIATVNTVHYRMTVSSQAAAMQGTSLVYTVKAMRTAYDETPVLNGKGEVAKGHDIAEFFGNKARKSDKTADRQATIELATEKPLQVRVQVNEVRNFHAMLENEWKTEDTSPSTYLVLIIAPPLDVRAKPSIEVVGTFFDEDHANRVAKAYAHAIDLLRVAPRAETYSSAATAKAFESDAKASAAPNEHAPGQTPVAVAFGDSQTAYQQDLESRAMARLGGTSSPPQSPTSGNDLESRALQAMQTNSERAEQQRRQAEADAAASAAAMAQAQAEAAAAAPAPPPRSNGVADFLNGLSAAMGSATASMQQANQQRQEQIQQQQAQLASMREQQANQQRQQQIQQQQAAIRTQQTASGATAPSQQICANGRYFDDATQCDCRVGSAHASYSCPGTGSRSSVVVRTQIGSSAPTARADTATAATAATNNISIYRYAPASDNTSGPPVQNTGTSGPPTCVYLGPDLCVPNAKWQQILSAPTLYSAPDHTSTPDVTAPANYDVADGPNVHLCPKQGSVRVTYFLADDVGTSQDYLCHVGHQVIIRWREQQQVAGGNGGSSGSGTSTSSGTDTSAAPDACVSGKWVQSPIYKTKQDLYLVSSCPTDVTVSWFLGTNIGKAGAIHAYDTVRSSDGVYPGHDMSLSVYTCPMHYKAVKANGGAVDGQRQPYHCVPSSYNLGFLESAK